MYNMKESVAVAKEADAKKGFSPTKSGDSSIQRLRDEHERQLGSLRGVIGNIRRDGGMPSVENIATELSSMHTTERVPVLLALQQTHGNRYVQRVVAGIQAKLVVGQPGDVYEQEADRVADAVMKIPEVKRQVGDEEIVQAKKIESTTPEVTDDLESQIHAIRGGGQPLAESERTFFELRFGSDFSQVRVHSDAQAAESAQAVNARAYTVEQDVVFGAGQYAPGTTTGKKLLAHELTHVVQQGKSPEFQLSYVRSHADLAEQKAGSAEPTLTSHQQLPPISISISESTVARSPDWPISQRQRYDSARVILERDYHYEFIPGPEDDIAPTYWTVLPPDDAPFEVDRENIVQRLEALVERHQGGTREEGEGSRLQKPSWLLPDAREYAELVYENHSLVNIGIDVFFYGRPITIQTGSGDIRTHEQGLQFIRTPRGLSIEAFRFYPTNRDDPFFRGQSENVFNSYQEWNAQFYDFLLDVPIHRIESRMHRIEQATLEQMMYMVMVSGI